MTAHEFKEILENSFINNLVREFPRSSIQLNKLQESDAELVEIPDSNTIIALTMDGLSEEIETGLYSSPYLIGWMAVMVNTSDLAAVGAQPVGILINETLPREIQKETLKNLQKGIKEACIESDISVLGGDTNYSSKMHISGCAIGVIPDKPLLTRVGCNVGDYLFSTGLLGQGSSFAFEVFSSKHKDSPIPSFKPRARIQEGQFIREYASCCMDTSDGFLPALDQIMRLNKVGFTVDVNLETILHPEALMLAKEKGFPYWMLLAGPHGEFELLFTVPPKNLEKFLSVASKKGFKFQSLGKAVESQRLFLSSGTEISIIDTSKIRNFFDEAGGDIEKYIHMLFEYEHQR